MEGQQKRNLNYQQISLVTLIVMSAIALGFAFYSNSGVSQSRSLISGIPTCMKRVDQSLNSLMMRSFNAKYMQESFLSSSSDCFKEVQAMALATTADELVVRSLKKLDSHLHWFSQKMTKYGEIRPETVTNLNILDNYVVIETEAKNLQKYFSQRLEGLGTYQSATYLIAFILSFIALGLGIQMYLNESRKWNSVRYFEAMAGNFNSGASYFEMKAHVMNFLQSLGLSQIARVIEQMEDSLTQSMMNDSDYSYKQASDSTKNSTLSLKEFDVASPSSVSSSNSKEFIASSQNTTETASESMVDLSDAVSMGELIDDTVELLSNEISSGKIKLDIQGLDSLYSLESRESLEQVIFQIFVTTTHSLKVNNASVKELSLNLRGSQGSAILTISSNVDFWPTTENFSKDLNLQRELSENYLEIINATSNYRRVNGVFSFEVSFKDCFTYIQGAGKTKMVGKTTKKDFLAQLTK